MSRLGKQRQRVRADAGYHQQENIKYGDGQREAQHPPRPMRMSVCAMRMHVLRIAQASLCGADTPFEFAEGRLCPRACAKNTAARVKVA